jgi:hypothetical protein
MKKKIGKEIGIGLMTGVLANVAGSYLYIYFLSKMKKLSVESTLDISLEQGLIGNIIILGALLNFVVFFVFLKKKQFYRARGVIMATLIAAIVILVSKFF